MLDAGLWAAVLGQSCYKPWENRQICGGEGCRGGVGRGQEMANLSSHCTMKCSNWSGYRLSGGQPAYRHTWPRENSGHLSSSYLATSIYTPAPDSPDRNTATPEQTATILIPRKCWFPLPAPAQRRPKMRRRVGVDIFNGNLPMEEI